MDFNNSTNAQQKVKTIILYLLCFLMMVINVTVQAQDMKYTKKVIKKLTSPAFKGRGYEANGDKIASAFIASEFKKSGLLTLNNGSYFHDFELSANTFPGKMSIKVDGKLLQTAVDYLIDATSPSIKGDFNVLPVTREAINTPEKLITLVNRAKGLFILLDNRVSSDESADLKQIISENINKLKKNPEYDFKGLILFSEDRLIWTSLTYQNPRPIIHINKKNFDPSTASTLTLNIEAKLIPDYQTRNVVGMVKGTSDSDSTLVISAHYDHLGQMGKKVYFPGANDNASGTTFMLNLVRHYSKTPPKYNTVFIAFSGEEIGLLGSKAFVKNPLIDLSKIKFLLNFDLAGTGEDGIKVVNGKVFRSQFDQLVELNDIHKLVRKVDIRGEACKSDHCPFYELGVPSFFIYTLGGTPAYHDIYDKAENLPFTAFENYFKLMVKFIQIL